MYYTPDNVLFEQSEKTIFDFFVVLISNIAISDEPAQQKWKKSDGPFKTTTDTIEKGKDEGEKIHKAVTSRNMKIRTAA